MLQRRYPEHWTSPTPDATDPSTTTVLITFVPSDPDWPAFLGIVQVTLKVALPKSYPAAPPCLTVTDSVIPDEIAQYMNASLVEFMTRWYASRSLSSPVRAAINWVDANLEHLFVEAARQVWSLPAVGCSLPLCADRECRRLF